MVDKSHSDKDSKESDSKNESGVKQIKDPDLKPSKNNPKNPLPDE